MKNFYLFVFSISFLVCHIASAQKYSFDNPADYNNHVVEEQNAVMRKSIDYTVQTVHSEDENKNNAMRLEVIKQIDQSIGELKNTAPYKNDAKLRDESIDVLTLYKEAFTTEFQEVNSLKKKSQDSFEAMDKYFKAQDKAENKLSNASKKFAKAQMDFATKYKLTMEKGSMQDELDVITKVNQYSRALFLEQFKVSKVNAGFLDALNAQKGGVMGDKRKELQTVTASSLANVKALSPYNGDKVYKAATQKLVEYYKSHADKEYLEMENIMKMAKPTNKDVERFNSLVTQMNEETTKLVQDFNKANKEFMRVNIPNPNK
ncbi:MAG: hypothetical protein ACJ75J_08930 [Cytophagaceae bacterium]